MNRKSISAMLICAILISMFFITSVSANTSSPEVEVYYSSYNDLDLQYTLTNMTNTKNLRFSSSWQEISDDITKKL